MTSKDDGATAGQPDQSGTPEPDQPDTPTWRSVKRGAKWGSLAGFVVSHLIIAANSIDTPFGSIYGGNMGALFAVCIGVGAALGAGAGWLNAQDIADDDRPPPSFPREPYG
jgi:hypothetical protein